jgi:hypothetical protein
MRLVILLLLLSCYCTAQTIKPVIMYDMSDASAPLSGGGGPEHYFDQYGKEDPKNGIYVYDNTVAAPYRADYWYPQQIIFDLVGDKDIFRLLKYKLTALYGLDNSGYGAEVMEFYNLDQIVTAPIGNRPAMNADWSASMKPFAVLTTNVNGQKWTNQWQSTTCNDSMRYVGIRLPRNQYGYHANFTELVIYGTAGFNLALVNPFKLQPDRPAPKTYHQMSGVNNLIFTRPDYWKYHGPQRWYGILAQYDNDTTAFPNNKYNFRPNQFRTGQA